MKAVIVTLALLTFGHSTAEACVTCATGDPSLAAMGNDAWSERSWRTQMSLRMRSFATEGIEIDERRLGLAIQYAPTSRLSLMARQFVAHQSLSLANLAEERRYVFSDPWLGARVLLFRSAHFAPRHVWTMDVGVTLPVVDIKESAVGPAGREAQLTGERAELSGALAYPYRRQSVALLFRASLRSGDDPAVLSQVRLAYQPNVAVSFVLGSTFQRVLAAPADTIVAASFGFRARVGASTFGMELALPIYVDVLAGDAGPILYLDWVFDA